MTAPSDTDRHYKQEPRRKAEFIRPPNTLKAKVGSGGIGENILNKAQALLESNTVDFLPLGEMYLMSLQRGVDAARSAERSEDSEAVLANIIYPAMQLKANGGMFHYPLITKVADKLIQFLEVVEWADEEVVEIVMAYHTTMRAIILGRVTGTGGAHGEELMEALNDACMRYFQKNPNSPRDMDFDYIHKAEGPAE